MWAAENDDDKMLLRNFIMNYNIAVWLNGELQRSGVNWRVNPFVGRAAVNGAVAMAHRGSSFISTGLHILYRLRRRYAIIVATKR